MTTNYTKKDVAELSKYLDNTTETINSFTDTLKTDLISAIDVEKIDALLQHLQDLIDLVEDKLIPQQED